MPRPRPDTTASTYYGQNPRDTHPEDSVFVRWDEPQTSRETDDSAERDGWMGLGPTIAREPRRDDSFIRKNFVRTDWVSSGSPRRDEEKLVLGSQPFNEPRRVIMTDEPSPETFTIIKGAVRWSWLTFRTAKPARNCRKRNTILLAVITTVLVYFNRWCSWSSTGNGCPVQFGCHSERFGTDYGGRVLPLPVLGYVSQLRNPLLISYGVGQDVSFEVCLACLTGSTVHLFDPSPHAERHVEYLNLVVNRPWLFGYLAKMFTEPAIQEVSGGVAYKDYWEVIRRSNLRRNQLVLHREAFGHADG